MHEEEGDNMDLAALEAFCSVVCRTVACNVWAQAVIRIASGRLLAVLAGIKWARACL